MVVPARMVTSWTRISTSIGLRRVFLSPHRMLVRHPDPVQDDAEVNRSGDAPDQHLKR